MSIHPSHNVRTSVDASTFDIICDSCGETDGLGTLGELVNPCSNPQIRVQVKWNDGQETQLFDPKDHGGITVFLMNVADRIANERNSTGEGEADRARVRRRPR